MTDTTTEVTSTGDRIEATINGDTVEGDWRAMQRLANAILDEADTHKTDLQKAAQINGAHIRVSCDCCDWEREFDSVSEARHSRLPGTPEEHADESGGDCKPEDVDAEPFCPRHGPIPFGNDECEGCADARNVINR